MDKPVFSIENLEAIVKNIGNIKYVSHDSNSVAFQYHDKDGNDIVGTATIVDKKELAVTAMFSIPSSHAVSAILACNSYNQRNDIYGTFSYAGKSGEDKFVAVLESDIDTVNSSGDDSISLQLQNFIEHINLWETKFQESLQQFGEDKSFMKGGFMSQLGSFFGAVLPFIPLLLGGDSAVEA